MKWRYTMHDSDILPPNTLAVRREKLHTIK